MVRSRVCIQVFISLLQLYLAGGATLGPPDPIVTAGEEEEYKVKSILRHRWWGQVMEYLVHYHGYDETEDSWVSEQDLIHAQQILQ